MAAVRYEVSNWTLGDAVDDPGEYLLRMLTQSRRRQEEYSAEIERMVGESESLRKALIGKTYNEFGKQNGEYVRSLVKLEGEERDRGAYYAKLALSAGIAERQVRVAEKQGAMLAVLLTAVRDDPAIGLTPQQKEAFGPALRRHLTIAVNGPAAKGITGV
jgi:hypothetical protein